MANETASKFGKVQAVEAVDTLVEFVELLDFQLTFPTQGALRRRQLGEYRPCDFAQQRQ
jgi:hypothetical protein